MRLIEQNRHFSQHRSRFGDAGDDGVAFEDLKPSLDQHIQVAGRTALLNQDYAGGYASLMTPDAIVQNSAHTGEAPNPSKIRHEERCRRTDNASGLLKLSASRKLRGRFGITRTLRCRQEIADRIKENLRRLQLRDMRASRNNLQTRVRQTCRSEEH